MTTFVVTTLTRARVTYSRPPVQRTASDCSLVTESVRVGLTGQPQLSGRYGAPKFQQDPIYVSRTLAPQTSVRPVVRLCT